MPNLLGYEWHKWVKEQHQLLKHLLCSLHSCSIARRAVGRLNHLQVPATEIVPEQLIGNHQRLRDAVILEIILNLCQCCIEAVCKPRHSLLRAVALCQRSINLPAVDKAVCVPNFITEVTPLLAESIVEHQVVTSRRAEHHRYTHTVCTILGNQVEWVRRVAQLLRHLTTNLIAHDTCEVDISKWLLATILISRHNHSGNPEEDNIRTGYEVIGWVVVLNLLIIRVANTIKYRDRPQPRREPSVKHIVILAQVRQSE